MNRTTIIRTLILAGVVFSSAVSAGTEIVKCIDQDGHVTLTDAICPATAKVAVMVAGSNEPGDSPMIGDMPEIESTAAERYSMPRVAKRELPAVKAQPARGALARDVATLKAARANLSLFDSAAQTLRAQRIALQ